MSPDGSPASSDPRPSAEEVRRLLAGELSVRARLGYVALLLVGLGGAAVTGSLVVGEVGLPARTTLALTALTGIGLSWVAFATWTLARRKPLLALHRLVAARMAVAFSAVFTLGAAVVGWTTDVGASWRAAGSGLLMLGVASVVLLRARRRVADLRRRRAELEGWLGAVWIALVLAGAPDAGSAQTVPAAGLRTEAGTFQIGEAVVRVERGSFTVPANRSRAGEATLVLRYVRFPTTAESPAPPIVFLAGGPGDAATRAFQGMPSAFLDSLRGVADVIAFDQRGTGSSEPTAVACEGGGMLPRAEVVPAAARADALAAQLRACLERAPAQGVDVSGLNTAESADDLEALRRALGAPKLALLAGSYGTHLALAALRRHPGSIARVALLGVEGPDHTLKLPSRVDEVIERIAAARRPSLAEDLRSLRGRLSEEPATFTFGPGQTLALGEWDLQRWIADALDTEREISAMLDALPAVLAGDYTELARAALPYRLPRPLNLMNVAVDCASGASPERLARIRAEAAASLLGSVLDFPLPDLCHAVGLPPLPDDFRAPITSDVPALLVSGSFDGRTPVANAAEVAAGMPNARQVVIEGASHDLFRRPEVMREIVAFFGASRQELPTATAFRTAPRRSRPRSTSAARSPAPPGSPSGS